MVIRASFWLSQFFCSSKVEWPFKVVYHMRELVAGSVRVPGQCEGQCEGQRWMCHSPISMADIMDASPLVRSYTCSSTEVPILSRSAMSIDGGGSAICWLSSGSCELINNLAYNACATFKLACVTLWCSYFGGTAGVTRDYSHIWNSFTVLHIRNIL